MKDGKPDKPALKTALAAFGQEHGIRRVRLLKVEEKFIALNSTDGTPYKAYIPGDNHCVEIYELPNGKWAGEGISVFDANRKDYTLRWRTEHPDAKLVMRVHKGDLLKLEHGGQNQVMRVYALEPSAKRVRLVPHNEGGNPDQRHVDPNDPFERILMPFAKMRAMGARRVTVDHLGRLRDPGPPK